MKRKDGLIYFATLPIILFTEESILFVLISYFHHMTSEGLHSLHPLHEDADV